MAHFLDWAWNTSSLEIRRAILSLLAQFLPEESTIESVAKPEKPASALSRDEAEKRRNIRLSGL